MFQITYFAKIVAPDTYIERGDSACYIIVDCLFTRAFWDRFTWTGINRGNKSKKGFREFANVLQLILAIVRVGDPTYTSQKLETFCKTRLFRYSKARSISKQLRKSACRPNRKKQGQNSNQQDEINCDGSKSEAVANGTGEIDEADEIVDSKSSDGNASQVDLSTDERDGSEYETDEREAGDSDEIQDVDDFFKDNDLF